MQGLTGSILAVEDLINAWSRPALFHHSRGDVGPAAAVSAAQTLFPSGHVAALYTPKVERGVYMTDVVLRSKQHRWVYVDPSTALVNGVRNPSAGFTHWVERLHGSLLQTGRVFGVIPAGRLVGWLGVLTLLALLTGIYLWYWPSVKRWSSLLQVRRVRGRYARRRNLHRTIGVLSFPLLCLVLLTGVNLKFKAELRPAWYSVTASPDQGGQLPKTPPRSRPPVGGRPVTPEAAMSTARRALPHATPTAVVFPAKTGAPLVVMMTRGLDPALGRAGQGGDAAVFIDANHGNVLKVTKASDKSLGGQLYEYWSFPVHGGVFGGLVTRLLWLIVGLLPLALAITGVAAMAARGRRGSRLRAVKKAFPRLDRAKVADLAARASVQPVPAGKVIVKEGDAADSFYVVLSGTVGVVRSGATEPHRHLGSGSHFGEVGLLTGGTRTATVVAEKQVELLAFDRAGFARLLDMSEETGEDLLRLSNDLLAADEAAQPT